MKKAIVIRAFSQSSDFLGGADFLACEEDFLTCFQRALAAGFEAVQLYVEREGYFSLSSDDKVARKIAAGAQQMGVGLTSLEIEPFSFSLTDDDADIRKQGREVVCRALEIAAVMGIEGVLVIPGYVGLPWEPSARPVRYDLAYDRTRQALTDLAPVAEKLGVSVLIENVWNKFLMSPLEMRGLIDEVGSDHVGVLFDTGNVVQFGYPEQWIRILGPRIQEIHLKDFRQAVGTVEGFVNLLEGDVNWPEVVKALREIAYDGFLTAEMFPYQHHGDAILQQTSEAMDRILGRKQQ